MPPKRSSMPRAVPEVARRKAGSASAAAVEPSRVPPPRFPVPRDTKPVDEKARSYRMRSLYRYLRSDSEAHDPRKVPAMWGAARDYRLPITDDAAELAARDVAAQTVVDLRANCFERLHAGQPVVIPRWRLDVDGHIWASEYAHIPWMLDRSVHWLEVDADDVVAPVAGPRPFNPLTD